jgi:hypothetical protein
MKLPSRVHLTEIGQGDAAARIEALMADLP